MDGPVQTIAPAGGAFLIQDPAVLNPRLQRVFLNLGGTWDREANGYTFQTDEAFRQADLVLNSFLDQTVISDRNAYFVREVLTSRDPFYTEKFGGNQRRLVDGTFAYEFPSPQHAANALALVYEARQLEPRHFEGLDIVRETLPPEKVAELFGPEQMAKENILDGLDRWGAIGILRDARPLLYDLGISPSHEKNIERLELMRENLDAEQSLQAFGFDTILDPVRYEELTADHVATAKTVMNATPMMRDLGINLNQQARERERLLNPVATARVARPERVADTALASENLSRDIGAYAEDEKERLAAERDELAFGPERLKVAKSLREALDLEGKSAGEEVEIRAGDVVMGRIVSYNANVLATGEPNEIEDFDKKVAQANFVYTPMTKTLRDVNGEFIGVEISELHRPNPNSFTAAPVGTQVDEGINKVALTRPDGSRIEYSIGKTADERFQMQAQVVSPFPGKVQLGAHFGELTEAKKALAEIATKARVSAGLQDEIVGKRGYAIVPINQFAHPVFQKKYSVRRQMADEGQPLTLAVQPDNKIVHANGHLARPVVRMVQSKNHVVDRPIVPEMIADYNAVLALTKLQAASDIRAIAAKQIEKCKQQGSKAPDWAEKGLTTQPSAIKERIVSNVEPSQAGTAAGIECEVKNVGQYYVGVRNGFNVSIHEKSAFPVDREFVVGERFGVVYEDGIPREYDPKEPVLTYERVNEVVLNHVPARDMDGAAVLESREAAQERRTTAGAVLGFMEQSNDKLAKWANDAHIAQANAKDSFVMYGKEDTLKGNVLVVDHDLGLASIARSVNNEPAFTIVNLKHFEQMPELGVLDQVAIAVNDERFTLTEHRTRAELMQDFKKQAAAALAKEQSKPVESIINRDVNPQNDLLVGDVLVQNHHIQAFALKTGPNSVATYDAHSIERPLEVGDKVTIVSRDYSNTVTSHTPKVEKERALAQQSVGIAAGL